MPSATESGAPVWFDLSGSTPKSFYGTSTRVVSPEQTVKRLRGLLPVMGITRVANVTGLDTVGIPVVMVCRPNSRSLAVAQGKGGTLSAAKASGLMESIESYHAEGITRPLLFGSYEELRYTRRLVDPSGLPRLELSAFRPTMRILWIEGLEIPGGDAIWLPFEVVHTDYTQPSPAGSGCFLMSSNGLASGNHVLEAVSHGICEVIERDAWTLWRFRGSEERDERRVNLDTVGDVACRELFQRYECAGIEFAVWDMTTDIRIACIVCTIHDGEQRDRRLYSSSGAGCHPDRRIALYRALTEAAQSRLTLISGSRDDASRSGYDRARDRATLNRNAELVESVEGGRNFDQVPTYQSETLEGDVLHELRSLTDAGFSSVIAVDLSRPEFRIPVVRIVVPNLEGVADASGYVPGARAQAAIDGRR